MNKTKRVAWHKHLVKAQKFKEKQRQNQKTTGSVASSTARR
jgi:hypothetical protein